LLVIIGEVYYFSNKGFFNETISKVVENKNEVKSKDSVKEKIEITMITDKRCGDKCNVDPIISQLKQVPSLSSIEIKVLDYSDD
jgi:hypothetical protein